MTRKDYVVIAAALASTRPRMTADDADMAAARRVLGVPSNEQWMRDRDAVAMALKKDNPLFNTAEFIKATLQ